MFIYFFLHTPPTGERAENGGSPPAEGRDSDNVCGVAYTLYLRDTKQLKAAGNRFNCDFMQIFAEPRAEILKGSLSHSLRIELNCRRGPNSLYAIFIRRHRPPLTHFWILCILFFSVQIFAP